MGITRMHQYIAISIVIVFTCLELYMVEALSRGKGQHLPGQIVCHMLILIALAINILFSCWWSVMIALIVLTGCISYIKLCHSLR